MVQAGVWIEFEQGDADYPIWTGCFYGSPAEVPVLSHLAPPAVPAIVLQTALQNGILISDVPGPAGGIMLKSQTGLSTLILNDTGIYLTSGVASIIISAATGAVAINGPALTVL